MTRRSVRSWAALGLRLLLLATVVGFAGYYLARQWSDIVAAVAQVPAAYLVGSMVFVLLGLAAITVAWVRLLNGLGAPVPLVRGAQISLVGSLGKYVPGSLWAYVLQMELGRASGVGRTRVLIASLYAAGVGVVSSLLLGSLALPLLSDQPGTMWLFVLLPVGLVCLHPRVMTALASFVLRMAKRPPLRQAVTGRAVAAAVAWTLVGYLSYGMHLWLLGRALVPGDLRLLVLVTGAMSIGFTLGLLAFLLPSGVGVREAVLIAAMSVLMTQAQASAVSLLSRAMFTVGDLAAAGLAAAAAVLWRPASAPAGVSDEDEVAPVRDEA